MAAPLQPLQNSLYLLSYLSTLLHMSEPTNFSLEETLTELRKLVDDMQKGVGDFDQQIALFQKGQTLIKTSRDYLDKSELQVQKLINGELTDSHEE